MARRPFAGDFRSTLAAARAGDGAAFEALWRWLAPGVAAYFRHHGERDPDDLTSETFLRVFRDLARFEGDERSFRSWVFVVAHHRWIDERRAAGRRPTLHDGAAVDDDPAGAGGGAVSASAEDDALRALSSEDVRARIGELLPDQRDVLLLRLFGDLTIEQIAEATSRSIGATKALQRRGLARIARRIGTAGDAPSTTSATSGTSSSGPVPLPGSSTVTWVP